jgi:hypothetical protein
MKLAGDNLSVPDHVIQAPTTLIAPSRRCRTRLANSAGGHLVLRVTWSSDIIT